MRIIKDTLEHVKDWILMEEIICRREGAAFYNLIEDANDIKHKRDFIIPIKFPHGTF